jgi:hypothetical protein
MVIRSIGATPKRTLKMTDRKDVKADQHCGCNEGSACRCNPCTCKNCSC